MQIRQQKGIFVLGLALVILLLMGLFALVFEMRSIQKFQIVASQYRGEQALTAAEAGLNYGVAYVIEAPTGATSPASSALSFATINSQLGSNAGQVTSITSSELDTNQYKIVAMGQSADGLVTRTVEHVINVMPQDPTSSGYKVDGWKDY